MSESLIASGLIGETRRSLRLKSLAGKEDRRRFNQGKYIAEGVVKRDRRRFIIDPVEIQSSLRSEPLCLSGILNAYYAPVRIGPRSNLPGNAPVCSFFRRTTWPLTTVASSPSDFCFNRRAPAGRS
jgi:hypothetical protein